MTRVIRSSLVAGMIVGAFACAHTQSTVVEKPTTDPGRSNDPTTGDVAVDVNADAVTARRVEREKPDPSPASPTITVIPATAPAPPIIIVGSTSEP